MASKENKTVLAYKGFNRDLKCRDFQYEIGKTYTHEGKIGLCESGFHACENPNDVLDFYPIIDDEGQLNRFAEVELTGEVKGDDKKHTASIIHIKKEISLSVFIKASVDFLFKACDFEASIKMITTQTKIDLKNASSGDNTQNASSGDNTKNASSGYNTKNASSGYNTQNASSGYNTKNASSGDNTQNASSGDNTQNASSGYNTQNASSGYNTKNASSGDNTKNASSGDNTQNASSGDNTKNASSGYNTKNASSGYNAEEEITGKDSVVAAIAHGAKVKACKGTPVALVHYKKNDKGDYIPQHFVTGIVGVTKGLKADVWYTLDVKGKIAEVKS